MLQNPWVPKKDEAEFVPVTGLAHGLRRDLAVEGTNMAIFSAKKLGFCGQIEVFDG